jgi:hypothetical protein
MTSLRMAQRLDHDPKDVIFNNDDIASCAPLGSDAELAESGIGPSRKLREMKIVH